MSGCTFRYLFGAAPSEPFRAGEQVALLDEREGYINMFTIDRISPSTGQVWLVGSNGRYKANGLSIGGATKRCIVRPDAALTAYVEKERLRRHLALRLEYRNTVDLPDNKLRRIAAILDEPDVE